MQGRTYVLMVLGLAALFSIARPSQAGLFSRRQPRQNVVVVPAAPAPTAAPVYYYATPVPRPQTYYNYAPAPRTNPFAYAPGRFGYNGDPPTAANGWGYGLAAAGYGTAYPVHPEGPGWPNYP